MFQFSLELPPARETLESCDACSNSLFPFWFRGLFFLWIVEIDVRTKEKGIFLGTMWSIVAILWRVLLERLFF